MLTRLAACLLSCRTHVRRVPDALFHAHRLLALIVLALSAFAHGESTHVTVYPLPAEVRSNHYRVTVNGHSADVLHAASNYYLLNVAIDGPVTVSVTAQDPHFWDAGVDLRPMRLGIRPRRLGATITFRLPGPQKIVLSRPGDHFANADMLFFFANPPEIRPDLSKVRYFGPGVYRNNLNIRSGEHVYLDGSAVILGGANFWQVHDARLSGPGTILYDGPQDAHSDEGWMQKPNWHCITIYEASNVEVDGITCITRSRSWQVQMRNSHHIGFFNIKVVGGNPNNANQDGMDWLGGGQTTVSNSFFRASDDVFALQGNWDGYEAKLLQRPGQNVTDISIEHTIASTSISNTVRVGWPGKTFNSAHVHMQDVDVLQTGFGACNVPFGFFELWADPGGHGRHTDYNFSNVRLEDWYSLLQLRQPAPAVDGVRFAGVWALDSPAMVSSVLRGDITHVTLRDTSYQGFSPAHIDQELGAGTPDIAEQLPPEAFTYTEGILHAGQPIAFSALVSVPTQSTFEWLFGDGTRASGPHVVHRYADSLGTLLDHSGRFRVLLHVRTPTGSDVWAGENIVLAPGRQSVRPYPGPLLAASNTPASHSGLVINIPRAGGYTLSLLTRRSATLLLDSRMYAHTPPPQSQVCGSPGNAVQEVRISDVLEKGSHRVSVLDDIAPKGALTPINNEPSLLLLEGPHLSRRVVAVVGLSRSAGSPDDAPPEQTQ